MSGGIVRQALQDRFESIRQAEVDRLEKKLRGLSEDERRIVEAITADVVGAIARVPARALADEVPEPALAAFAQLFALQF